MGFFKNLVRDIVIASVKEDLKDEIRDIRRYSVYTGCWQTAVYNDVEYARTHKGKTINEEQADYMEEHFDEILDSRLRAMGINR